MLIKSPICLAAIIALALPAASRAQQTLPSEPPAARPLNQAQQHAQEQQRRAGSRGNTGQGATQGGTRGHSQELANFLAGKLLVASQAQVELAKLASQKAESQQVKDLAEQISADHQNLIAQLKRQIPAVESVQSPFTASGQDTQRRSAPGQLPGDAAAGRQNDLPNLLSVQPSGERQQPDRAPGQPGAERQSLQQPQNQSGQFLDGAAQTLMDLTRRAIHNNHEMVTQMLGEKQGREFDNCFVAYQIGANTWMASELKATTEAGPQERAGPLGEFQQAEQAVKQHLQGAKQLAQSFEGAGGADHGSPVDRLNQPQRQPGT